MGGTVLALATCTAPTSMAPGDRTDTVRVATDCRSGAVIHTGINGDTTCVDQ